MEADRTLIATGAVGAVLAIICCATPLLAVVLGGVGLATWLARAGYVAIPALLIGLVLVGIAFYRRRMMAPGHCDPSVSQQGSEP